MQLRATDLREFDAQRAAIASADSNRSRDGFIARGMLAYQGRGAGASSAALGCLPCADRSRELTLRTEHP